MLPETGKQKVRSTSYCPGRRPDFSSSQRRTTLLFPLFIFPSRGASTQARWLCFGDRPPKSTKDLESLPSKVPDVVSISSRARQPPQLGIFFCLTISFSLRR
uniref:Uncharacterized protein n=1 Tax=Cannabis sativa TaxID=3483 RepID=A0A803NL44_CANSA